MKLQSKEGVMSKMTIVQTDLAPKPIGPYSQAVKSGGFMFCSGQIPLDPKTNEFVGSGDVKKQARQVLDNIKFLLSHEKLSLTDIVKTTIFLKNMSDFPHVNEIYGEYFTSNFPARSTIEVAALPKGALVEIEVIVAC